MKFVHLSDLHLGKRVNGFPMMEDQVYILKVILQIIDSEAPEAVVIAGDVYDKPVPPEEAVEAFDDFLVRLAARGLEVMIISGNHDSSERLSFGNRLMDASGIHIAPAYDGKLHTVTLTDEYGPVEFSMLPFIKPANVRRYYPDDEIVSYTDAVRAALRHSGGLDASPEKSGLEASPAKGSVRRVLITHQFVTGAERSDSEDISVGGTDNVDAAVFEGFDYVALGHLHGPQEAGGAPHIRYSGSPLKYSFSEARQQKSVTVVELGEVKTDAGAAEACGAVNIRTVPLTPLRDMTELSGTYEELTLRSFYNEKPWRGNYLRVTLKDENDVPDAAARLRVIYPNLMRLDYDNKRTSQSAAEFSQADVDSRTPLELFADFYKQQNNADMTEEQEAFVRSLIEEVWGDD